jgi:glutathione S-transferase
MLVPLLEDDGERFTQSMAIIEYLDEIQPEPPLLPHDPVGRARVRALNPGWNRKTNPASPATRRGRCARRRSECSRFSSWP